MNSLQILIVQILNCRHFNAVLHVLEQNYPFMKTNNRIERNCSYELPAPGGLSEIPLRIPVVPHGASARGPAAQHFRHQPLEIFDPLIQRPIFVLFLLGLQALKGDRAVAHTGLVLSHLEVTGRTVREVDGGRRVEVDCSAVGVDGPPAAPRGVGEFGSSTGEQWAGVAMLAFRSGAGFMARF